MERPKKTTADKTDNTTGRHKPKNIAERKETQKLPRQNQVIQEKQNLPKYRKKILPTNRWRKHKD